MPGCRPAHREASDGDPLRIDWVLLQSVFENLQRIDFASKLIRIAVPTEGMNHDHARFRGWIWIRHSRRNELQLQSFFATTSAPDVCTIGCIYDS